MSKNGSKSKSGKNGKLPKPKSKGGNGKKAKTKKTDSGKFGNAGSVKSKKIQKTVKKVKQNYSDKTTKLDSLSKINKFIKTNGRLRQGGKFISKEDEEAIKKAATTLDNEGIDYNLNELLKYKNMSSKMIITEDKTGKELFYYNLYHVVKNKSFGDNVKIVIKNFDGIIEFSGTNESEAVKRLQLLNHRITNIEKVITIKENVDNIYPTVPVFETRLSGETIKIVIDYSKINVRIPQEIFNKYRDSL